MFRLKHKFRHEGEGGDTGGGGNSSQQVQQTPGQQKPGNSQQQSGAENNKNAILNPWVIKDTIDDPDGKPRSQQTPQQQPAQNRDTPDVNAQMAQFIKGLKLTEGIDTAKIEEDLKEGNTESLHAAFEAIAANTFQQSMIQTNRLMDTRIKDAVDAAVEKATGNVNSSFAMRELHEKLEFTKDPAVEPIAKAVMQSLMKKNSDVNAAVGNTEKFFEQMSRVAAKHFKMIPPEGDAGSSPFGGGNIRRTAEPNEKTPDWLDVLTGTAPAEE